MGLLTPPFSGACELFDGEATSYLVWTDCLAVAGCTPNAFLSLANGDFLFMLLLLRDVVEDWVSGDVVLRRADEVMFNGAETT